MHPAPVCVLISDIHFNNNTLALAAASLKAALAKAEELHIPLVIAGDMHDTKAVFRVECINTILTIFRDRDQNIPVYVLIGNHDLVNEKAARENHALHFLKDYAFIVQHPVYERRLKAWLVPYYNDTIELKAFLAEREAKQDGSLLIMHQGIQGAFMGEYAVDKTSLPPSDFANFRVISGHYHRAQDIKCGRPRKDAVGLFSYIGTPYTISFAEAEDGPKGIQILMDNGLLQQIPLNLRRHVIAERTPETAMEPIPDLQPTDLLWLKVTGPKSEIVKLKKKALGLHHLGHENFKFDPIPTDDIILRAEAVEKLRDEEILDKLIEESSEPNAEKSYLKTLWREILQ